MVDASFVSGRFHEVKADNVIWKVLTSHVVDARGTAGRAHAIEFRGSGVQLGGS